MNRLAPLVLVAVLVAVPGCPRRDRPTLEPEGTVTRTWVGEEPAPPATDVEPRPPTATAPAEPAPDEIPPEEEADLEPAPPTRPETAPPTRRGWVKGGSWD